MSAEDTSRPLSEAGEEAFDSMLAAAAPGEILRTEIALGEYPDGLPMISPAIVARGRAAGPTLWVQACLHGPEVGGILGIHAFLKSLRIADLKGTIVFLLVTNPLGFRANQRLTPQDGANLNRAFPGSPDGGPTQQLADRIFRLAIRHADAMLDLHSGGDHAISAHYSIFTDEGDAPGAASRGMARAIGAPLLWNAPPASLKGAAYLAFCEAGKPAVLFESGGGARVTVTDIRNFANALVGASSNLGILPARAEPEEPLEGREVRNIFARRGGIFVASTEPNMTVQKGVPVGAIVNVVGDVTETFTAPFAATVVTATRRPNMAVYPGDEVLSLMNLG